MDCGCSGFTRSQMMRRGLATLAAAFVILLLGVFLKGV